jgi:hypothetical protein
LDFDTWYELALESMEAPEDWSGAYDELDPDDLGYSDDAIPDKKDDDPLKNLY